MPAVTLTVEFASFADLQAFLINAHIPGVSQKVVAQQAKVEQHKHNGVVQDVAAQEHAKPVEQPAPAPQPEASATKTVDDCIGAFKRYVAKGQGRTAGKFMNEVMQPKYGVRNINQVAPERLGELYADFEAA